MDYLLLALTELIQNDADKELTEYRSDDLHDAKLC